MWSDTKIAAIAGVAAVMATAAGYGVYSLIGDSVDSKSPKATATKPSPVKTGPPSAAEVQTIAHRFLTAWEAGDPAKAASLTDDREEAEVALTGYHKDAHITEAKLEPGKPTGSTVPFNVDATISYRGQKTPWTYGSKLKVVRDRKTGRALVDWQPSVVYPELRPGDSLKTGETEAPPIKAVDRNGTALSPKDHPALRGVFASLRKRYGAKAGGTASVELWIDRAKNKGGSADSGKDAKQPDQTLKVLSKGKPGTLRTTLDARLQGIAEQAVSKRPKAAVVAVKPSTGEILAVANSPAEGYNTAFQGSLAPGSTMKIITSALLLEKGLASYGEEHPCPKYATYGGWKFHNVDKFEIENGTFAQSFAASCNTAFITQAGKISDDALTKEAREVFGIGLNWQAGVPTFDGRVPVQTAAPKAASLIGQGGVRMNPLTMASASATVHAGTFHQPYIVSPSLDNRQLAKAAHTMPAGVVEQLRKLMRVTATSGTAAEAMAGLSGDIGAKTGSAEVDGQKKPNGWFTAYRGDLAAAAVVPRGGHGGSSAGPMVAQLLRAGG